jgi:hypothetical protein
VRGTWCDSRKAIYVPHCFQKKSPSGTRTATTDVEMIERRLKVAKADYEVRYGQASQKRQLSRGEFRERLCRSRPSICRGARYEGTARRFDQSPAGITPANAGGRSHRVIHQSAQNFRAQTHTRSTCTISESHRKEHPGDIVTTGANGVATDPVVSEGGPALTLMDFRAVCAALLGFALVHCMH